MDKIKYTMLKNLSSSSPGSQFMKVSFGSRPIRLRKTSRQRRNKANDTSGNRSAPDIENRSLSIKCRTMPAKNEMTEMPKINLKLSFSISEKDAEYREANRKINMIRIHDFILACQIDNGAV
jgi:hypothetical protein